MFHLCNPKRGTRFFCLQTLGWLSQIQSCALETVRDLGYAPACTCSGSLLLPELNTSFAPGSLLKKWKVWTVVILYDSLHPNSAHWSTGTLMDFRWQSNLWAAQNAECRYTGPPQETELQCWLSVSTCEHFSVDSEVSRYQKRVSDTATHHLWFWLLRTTLVKAV